MPANRPSLALNGHTVAGLIDAEAHFAIAEQNGGGSLYCRMVLALRDDDADLLNGLVRTTGLGTVVRKDQRGNPQAAWIVSRKDETSELVRFLTEVPLRSRKRLDFSVWSAAVRCWNGSDRDRVARMQNHRRAIASARAYTAHAQTRQSAGVAAAGFDDWLGGFVAGDGCFDISGRAPRLTVRLRADDRALLEGIRKMTCAGNVNGPYVNAGAHPSLAWNVTRTSELMDIGERLEGRIPGRKRLEFAVWRLAVEARADGTKTTSERRRAIEEATRDLKALRRYRPGAAVPPAKTRRLQRMYAQNGAWIVLLREWASTERGSLTAEAYGGARQAGWPTRNTLTRRFGS